VDSLPKSKVNAFRFLELPTHSRIKTLKKEKNVIHVVKWRNTEKIIKNTDKKIMDSGVFSSNVRYLLRD